MSWKPTPTPTLTGEFAEQFFKVIENFNKEKISKKEKSKIKDLVEKSLKNGNLY